MQATCEQRRMLAEQFAIAARQYAEAAVKLALSGDNYIPLFQITKDAQTCSATAFVALEEHVASHRCDGRPASEQSGGDVPPAEPGCATENAPGPVKAKSAGSV